MQGHPFGDTIGCPADRTSDMGAVPITIIRAGIVINEVVPCPDAPAKLGVGAAHTGVEHVDMNPRAVCGSGVATIER